MSWGQSEELLVGSSNLQLFETTKNHELIWSRPLSSPAAIAIFSTDAWLIASTANHDRLVKIWRRGSFGSDAVRFDFSYATHPSTVTGLQWRKAPKDEHTSSHVLYTVCADRKLRIWSATDPHALQILHLWSQIDLEASIQPRSLDSAGQTRDRHVAFIDSSELQSAIDIASKNTDIAPVLENLIEVASRNAEICLIIDNHGYMSAWGLQNIGGMSHNASDICNIAHVENFNMSHLLSSFSQSGFIQLYNFGSDGTSPLHSFLLHHFDGRIAWTQGNLVELFDAAPKKPRLQTKALWTGHENAVKKINRTAGGRAVISRTDDNEALVWKQVQNSEGLALVRSSSLVSREHIHRVCLLAGGNFVVNLHHQNVTLWDANSFLAVEVASCEYNMKGKPLCLILLPSPSRDSSTRYLATISSEMNGIVWQVSMPRLAERDAASGSFQSSIEQFCIFELGTGDDLAFVVPIDPAGSQPVVSGFLDTFAKDIALSYTRAGTLDTWTARIDVDRKSVRWLRTATVTTGVDEPSLASGTSIRKVALVNTIRNGLTIWDTSSGQLEFETAFGPGDTVQDLDWTSTPDDQSILAVGFPHKIMILAQIRYDYLDKGPAWAFIREIYIRESSPHPIGDSTWLGSGSLVIGAGNQLFAFDKIVAAGDDMVREISTAHGKSQDLFDTVSVLNGPLPIFHPQLLSQCILVGKLPQVQKILVGLNRVLKFFTEGEDLNGSRLLPLHELFIEQQVGGRHSYIKSSSLTMHIEVFFQPEEKITL